MVSGNIQMAETENKKEPPLQNKSYQSIFLDLTRYLVQLVQRTLTNGLWDILTQESTKVQVFFWE